MDATNYVLAVLALFLAYASSASSTRVLVVGSAGFLGYHLTYTLKERGIDVDGIDNFSGNKYSVVLKHQRAWDLLLSHQIDVKHFDVCDTNSPYITRESLRGNHYSHVIYFGAGDELSVSKLPLEDGCFSRVLRELKTLNDSSRPLLLATAASERDCVDSTAMDCAPITFNKRLMEIGEWYKRSHKVRSTIFQSSRGGGHPIIDDDIPVIGAWMNPNPEYNEGKVANFKFNVSLVEDIVDNFIGMVLRPLPGLLTPATFETVFKVFETSTNDVIAGRVHTQKGKFEAFSKWFHSSRNQSSNQVLCASECSPLRNCIRSGLDATAENSQKVTHGCSVVYYTVGFHREQYTLRSVDDSMMPSHCFVAFVKLQSPLGESNKSSHRGWQIIRTDFDGMDRFGVARRISRFPKIAPQVYFAKTVRYAIYFDTRNKPRMKPENFVKLMNGDKGKEVAVGMLFHPYELQTRRVRTASMEIGAILHKRYTAEVSKIKAQRTAYDRATEINKGKLLYQVTPTAWMIVHDLKSMQGHKFRCDWFGEYLTWADRDQPALFYVVAKTIMDTGMEVERGIDDTLVPLGGQAYLKLLNYSDKHRKYLPYFSMGLEKDKGYHLTVKSMNISKSESRNFG